MAYTREQWAALSEEERGPCEEWVGGYDGKGYGYVMVGGVQRIATRWTWEHRVGPIPEQMHVLHHCDNPPCVSVRHLFLGTHAENMADKMAKGRHRSGRETQTRCKHGHDFTPENTRVVMMQGYEVRVCVACSRGRRRNPEQRARANECDRARRRRSTRPCPDCGREIQGGQRGRRYCDQCSGERAAINRMSSRDRASARQTRELSRHD